MAFDRENYLQQLQWRYAVKRFDPVRKISEADWSLLAESLRLSPSSYGLQPWKFLVVQSPALREQLLPLSWNQKQVVDCSHFVVLATLKSVTEDYVGHFIQSLARFRGVDPSQLEGFKKSILGDVVHGDRAAKIQAWTQRQVYIAMGNLMTTAALLQIDSCPMEGLDPKKYDQVLGLEPSPYATVAAVALGFRHPEDKFQFQKKFRFPANEVFELLDR